MTITRTAIRLTVTRGAYENGGVNENVTPVVNEVAFGPIYTRRQQQCSLNDAMKLAILLSLKTIESLENEVATHFEATPVIAALKLTLGVNEPLQMSSSHPASSSAPGSVMLIIM